MTSKMDIRNEYDFVRRIVVAGADTLELFVFKVVQVKIYYLYAKRQRFKGLNSHQS